MTNTTRDDVAQRARLCSRAAVLVAAMLAAHGAHAQERPHTTITTNPIRAGLLHFQLEIDHALSEDMSLFAAPIVFHHATWYPFNKADGETATGGGLDFGARFVLLGAAPEGLYVGPLVSAYYGVEEADGRTLDGVIVSLGAQGGGNLILWDRLVLGAGVGASYGFPSEVAHAHAAEGAALPHAGLWVNFRTNIGVAF
jgi:hypothetical protein